MGGSDLECRPSRPVRAGRSGLLAAAATSTLTAKPATVLGQQVGNLMAGQLREAVQGGGGRWEIRAVSVTGSESWQIETDGLLDAVCHFANQLGLHFSDD